jgi:hypothetical protein
MKADSSILRKLIRITFWFEPHILWLQPCDFPYPIVQIDGGGQQCVRTGVALAHVPSTDASGAANARRLISNITD